MQNSKLNTLKPKIHIVGAGVSGLSVAYLLSKKNKFEITLFEKEDRCGGLIQSKYLNDDLVESAANSILVDDQVLDFLNEIKFDYISPKPNAKIRFFFRNGLRRWPLDFWESINFIYKIFFHLITLKKFLKIDSNETVSEWSIKKLGQPFTQFVLSAGLQGIYATSSDQLNAQITLGSLLNLNKEKKPKQKGIITGRTGMQNLIDALEKKCRQNLVKINLKTNYLEYNKNNNEILIVCTSATDAEKVVLPLDLELAKKIQTIEMNSIASVTCKLEKITLRPKGFGCLIPKNEITECLGILFNNDIFDFRSNTTSETYIFSSSEAEKINLLNNSDMQNYFRKLRFNILNSNENISHISKTFWKNGLPLYNKKMLNFQENYSENDNLFLHGNYLNGIGLSKIILNSLRISKKIDERFV